MYKDVYNEIPNFMYRNGTYTYVEAHVLFYKTWLIVLLTDASFEKLFLKVVLKEVFCTKKNCIKKRKRDLYSLIFERPLFYFHKTWWMVLKKTCDLFVKKLFWKLFEKKVFLLKKLYKERRKGLIL